MASPTVARRTSRTPVETDDVVMMRAAEMAAWTKKNAKAVIYGGAAIVLVLGGILYYQVYKSQRAERAATAFLTLQSTLPNDTAGVIRQLTTFASNYDGTSEAAESRILAAQLWMAKGDANRAVAVVRPAADGGTAVENQARMTLAAALAAAGKRQEAIDTYLDVVKGTKLAYLKLDALTAAATLREDTNDWKGAADLYRQALDATEKDTPDRAVVELHLSEAEAHAGLPITAPK
jgi:predicted negative regulator of RcsB-dependent stress response